MHSFNSILNEGINDDWMTRSFSSGSCDKFYLFDNQVIVNNHPHVIPKTRTFSSNKPATPERIDI